MNQIGHVVERLQPWKDERLCYGCCTPAQLVLCSTVLVLRQDSEMHWAEVAGNERVKNKSRRGAEVPLSFRPHKPEFSSQRQQAGSVSCSHRGGWMWQETCATWTCLQSLCVAWPDPVWSGCHCHCQGYPVLLNSGWTTSRSGRPYPCRYCL